MRRTDAKYGDRDTSMNLWAVKITVSARESSESPDVSDPYPSLSGASRCIRTSQ